MNKPIRPSTLTSADTDQIDLLVKEAVQLLQALGECLSASSLPNPVVAALYVEARPLPRLIASTEAGVRVLALRPAPQPAP
jgi:hypothetical protein